MHNSLKRYSRSEVAQQRLNMIRFYRQYGEKATKEAFGIDRKAINRPDMRLENAAGRLEALVLDSTKPHKLRESNIDYRVIAPYLIRGYSGYKRRTSYDRQRENKTFTR